MESEITIVGLGPGPLSLLSRGAEEELLKAEKLFFRISGHPVYHWLEERGKKLVCFDYVYTFPRFTYEDVYAFMVEALLTETRLRGRTMYALPGNPCVVESTTRMLQQAAAAEGIQVRIVPGMSFLELIYAELAVDPGMGIQIVRPGELHPRRAALSVRLGLVVCQIGMRPSPDPRCEQTNAETVTRWLLERYPGSHPVSIVWTAGMPEYETHSRSFPLAQLAERVEDGMIFASLYVPPLSRPAE